MDFTAGWIAERGSLLGSFGQGAFGNLSAGTAFFGFDGGLELGRWSIGATGEFGVVSPVTQGGMIQEISALATSTFAVHASRAFQSRGAVHFSLSQPLRVENGWVSLTVPAARTKRGEVLHRSLRADLAPGERQLDLAAQWNQPLPLGECRLGAIWSHWPGHRDVVGPQLAACGETHAAFERRCIPPEPRRHAALGVAFRSKYTRYSSLTRLVSRAPPRSRRSPGFHHRLLALLSGWRWTF